MCSIKYNSHPSLERGQKEVFNKFQNNLLIFSISELEVYNIH